jgi:phosphoadenosine phosphosulfate reductase
MAKEIGAAFPVCLVDTGRLHAETLEFVEAVRERYQLSLFVTAPDAARVEKLVAEKGLFSFYQDGHEECCAIRKSEPLARHLLSYSAWVTGRRRDQNASSRAALAAVELDPQFRGQDGPLIKWNPLCGWASADVWNYLQERGVPQNPLHARGFRSIGCAPCTRPVGPDDDERAGRWWWETDGSRECVLHLGKRKT